MLRSSHRKGIIPAERKCRTGKTITREQQPLSSMITVSCASCGAKLFRYQKIGKGRLLHCWKTRISSDHTRREGVDIFCPTCGQHIGVVETQWINMHGGSFTVKGSALKK
jgi:hypothetical protein